ncbi:MAG: hypothetical protein ACI81L_001449 [Verrucomicrobiales bacterium]|jgi:hypothetical protein
MKRLWCAAVVLILLLSACGANAEGGLAFSSVRKIDEDGMVTFPMVSNPRREVPAAGIELASLIKIADEAKA